MHLKRAGIAMALLTAASLAVGCTQANDGGATGGADGDVARRTAELEAASRGASGGSQDGAASYGVLRSATQLPEVGPSVIKTAEVEIGLPSGRLTDTVQKALGVARRYGGFVESTILDSQGVHRGTLVLRVPSTDFENALSDLRSFGDVRNERISGQDVSQEFVDLRARLRNWESQEAVLLRLMERSRTVSDSIRVQSELARVQLEIERLRGRLNFLEDQTSFGTITATFTAAGAAPSEPGTLERAWQEALDAALGVVSAVIVGAGFVVPIAALAGVVFLLVRGLRPRLTP